MKYNELIVFIIRETGWDLEYVRSLPIKVMNSLVRELQYQKSVDEYNRNYLMAVWIAMNASDQHRRRRPEEFIGQPPQREIRKEDDDLWIQAEKAGIKPPKA